MDLARPRVPMQEGGELLGVGHIRIEPPVLSVRFQN